MHPRINYILATLLILLMIALHQDWWLWTNNHRALGFIPVGLAYHAAYSVFAACTMALLVKLVWPKHLEDVQPLDPSLKRDTPGH